jgi:hypothetical protein
VTRVVPFLFGATTTRRKQRKEKKRKGKEEGSRETKSKQASKERTNKQTTRFVGCFFPLFLLWFVEEYPTHDTRLPSLLLSLFASRFAFVLSLAPRPTFGQIHLLRRFSLLLIPCTAPHSFITRKKTPGS